jgi:hypothetical protein
MKMEVKNAINAINAYISLKGSSLHLPDRKTEKSSNDPQKHGSGKFPSI